MDDSKDKRCEATKRIQIARTLGPVSARNSSVIMFSVSGGFVYFFLFSFITGGTMEIGMEKVPTAKKHTHQISCTFQFSYMDN